MAKPTWVSGVHESTPVTFGGLLDIELAGPVNPSRRPFSAVGDGKRCKYRVDDQAGEWEEGEGTYTLATNKVSRDRVITSSAAGAKVDFTPSVKDVILAWTAEEFLGQVDGQYTVALDGANVVVKPWQGNVLVIDGVPRQIPDAGVALAPTGLPAATPHNVYAAWVGAAMILEASTTAAAVEAGTGYSIKTGDPTRRWVASALTAGVGVWASVTALGNVAPTVWHDGIADTVRALLGVAPGDVVWRAANTAHDGWLKCNGAAISRATYADLFAAIGTTWGAGDGSTTFNVPDLRGEFVRGWDDGRGVDSGRVFASFQADEFKSHAHNITLNNLNGDGTVPEAAPSGATSTGATQAAGGAETRPRNRALLAIVKY